TAMFTVRIENVSTAKEYLDSGVFDTPAGANQPGPAGPGDAYEFSFDATRGAKLSFATMFVQSNDFFYAPDIGGIELYDANGNPNSGDVTSQVFLWDAGTEINQEPGLGADQAPRQAGPNTGAPDPDNTVRMAPDDFNNLPAVDQVIRVTLTSISATRFMLRIENISDSTTLSISTGGSVAVPLAPGVFVVHTTDAPLFTPGQPEPGMGLEMLAEDGNAVTLGDALAMETGITQLLAPGVWATHTIADPFFTSGQPDRGVGLEALAEDGDPGALSNAIGSMNGIVKSGVFNTPVGAGAPGPLTPGTAYEFTFEATEGEMLSFATMFVQSNDLFYAPNGQGIELFQNGQAISGDVTSQIMLWDAGTEVNEMPGFGFNQAPRQTAPNTGSDENGVVQIVNDGFSYPAVDEVIKVTVTPQ
ncbi:MAG: hypothetical protein D6732_15745, partial [Methanobacteriota archaeon]